jgi:hypothetical protein
MTKPLDVFCEIPCLTETKQLSGIALQRKWFKSADKRYISLYLQKFIDYNSSQFDFLGAKPCIIGSDQNVALSFRTSGFVGATPLRAPDTGKQIGDFVIIPRFSGSNKFEDYIEILNVLESEISPEIIDSFPLASGTNFRPPLYLEAVKFVSLLEELAMSSWRKFDTVEKITNQPLGQVNWTKYINNEYKVENKLKFLVAKNVLSELHEEYAKLRYVFDVCKIEILSTNTPFRVKNMVRNKLKFLNEKLYCHKPQITKEIAVHFGDTPIVKKCKEQANKILNFNLAESTAWRIDFSDVFEKFVQFIFNSVAKEVGGHVYSNYKFRSNASKYYSWELKHIEPDVIYQKGKNLVFIDAKYKSNLYNKFGQSEMIKEDHRRDLHQILAYNSFSGMGSKFAFLCYPSKKTEIKSIHYNNSINEVVNTIFMTGIPLNRDSIDETKRVLINTLHGFEAFG